MIAKSTSLSWLNQHHLQGLHSTYFAGPKHWSGWWYTYPSEKYEFVSWDDEKFPFLNGQIIKFHGSKQQPAMCFLMSQTPGCIKWWAKPTDLLGETYPGEVKPSVNQHYRFFGENQRFVVGILLQTINKLYSKHIKSTIYHQPYMYMGYFTDEIYLSVSHLHRPRRCQSQSPRNSRLSRPRKLLVLGSSSSSSQLCLIETRSLKPSTKYQQNTEKKQKTQYRPSIYLHISNEHQEISHGVSLWVHKRHHIPSGKLT